MICLHFLEALANIACLFMLFKHSCLWSLKEWLQSIGSVLGTSWTHLLLLYAYVQVSRCIVVGALFPFLRYFGYGLDWKEAIILIWSGLRGAVALALSLSVKASIHWLMMHIYSAPYWYNSSRTLYLIIVYKWDRCC